MLQRGGELRFRHIKITMQQHIRPPLIENIAKGAGVHTDESSNYKWMNSDYAHDLVKHTLDEYVRDDVTTNRIEGAFGHFKRAVHGVYHKVSDEHIHHCQNNCFIVHI